MKASLGTAAARRAAPADCVSVRRRWNAHFNGRLEAPLPNPANTETHLTSEQQRDASAPDAATRSQRTKHECAGLTGTDARNRVPKRASLECSRGGHSQNAVRWGLWIGRSLWS
jgi:hypothetical protein